MADRLKPSPLRRRLVAGTALIVVLLAALALVSRSRTIRLGDTHPPDGSLVRIDGVLLHYEIAGSGSPVLLLHGCPGFTRDYRMTLPGHTSVFQDLARDHTVIALDRPGHGWSGRYADRYTTLPAQADLVPQFLDALGLESAVVVGHSYAGALALATAVEHPEAVLGLVLLGAATHPDSYEVQAIDRILVAPVIGPIFRWSLSPVLVPAMAKEALTAVFAPESPPPGYGDVLIRFIARPEQLHQMAIELVRLSSELAELAPHYAELSPPLTIIVGTRDDPSLVRGNKRLAEEVPGARLIVEGDLGHEVPHLRPELVAAEVRRLTAGGGAPSDGNVPAAPSPAPD